MAKGLFKFKKRENKDILVAKITVDNEDTFHLKNLYKLIHDWLDD